MKTQEFRKMRIALGPPVMTFNISTLVLCWCQKARRTSKKLNFFFFFGILALPFIRNWKLIWKHNEGEIPYFDKGNRLPGSPGNSESPQTVGPKEAHLSHIIITSAKRKDKERILKAAREKETVTSKGVAMRPSADFSKQTLQGRVGWKEGFEVMESKDIHPKLLYPSKLSFRIEGQVKCRQADNKLPR